MTKRVPVTLRINGEVRSFEVEPRKLLVDAIREDAGLTGTHVGCEHGVCGACTVLLDGESVRSCLLFAVQAQGHQIETIEGMAATVSEMQPLQQSFWDHHGLQCGFCTSGIIMVAKEFLEHNPSPTDEEIREAIAGNICRCTGYVFIVEAIRAASKAMAESRGGA